MTTDPWHASSRIDDQAPISSMIIVVLALGQIVSWGTTFFSFPLYAIQMGEALGVGRAQIYIPASLGMAIGGLSSVLIGPLIGRGFGRVVMTAGSLLGGVLLVVLSRVDTPYQLYPIFFGVGIAQAMTFYDAVFAEIATRKLGDIRPSVSIVTLIAGFASTVFVPIADWMLDHLSWRDTVALLGLIQLVVCVPLHWVVLRSRRTKGSVKAGDAASVGAHARGAALRLRRTPTFWLLLISLPAYQAVFATLMLHLYPMLREQGGAQGAVVLAIGMLGPSQAISRILVWRMPNFLSLQNLAVGALAVALAAMLMIQFGAGSEVKIVLFGLMLGLSHGAMAIVRGASVAELLGRRDYGRINGLIAAPGAVATALAPAGAAWLWTGSSSYRDVLLVLTGTLVLVLVCLAIACRLAPAAGSTGR